MEFVVARRQVCNWCFFGHLHISERIEFDRVKAVVSKLEMIVLRVRSEGLVKNSHHPQPLYLTRLVNIFFFLPVSFQFAHESLEELTSDMPNEITVHVPCGEMQ